VPEFSWISNKDPIQLFANSEELALLLL
jgi:hypothetical protein